MNEKKDMNGAQIIGYGLGSLGKDLALGVMGSYLLLFYTDVFGIPAIAAGMIFLFTKIWDAVNDPMMGVVVDRSPVTKRGKYRPYILFTCIPLAVFCVLCFLAPDFSTGGKIAYAAITYTITGMIFTAYDVPLWSMVPSLSTNENTKNKLISAARTFTTIGMFIASAAAYNFIIKLGGGESSENLKKGYPIFMVLIGVISVVFALITYFCTKETNVPDTLPQEANVFKGFVKIMCKPLVLVLLAMVFTSFTMILPTIAGTYYMIYFLGRPDMIGAYMGICMGSGIITSVLAPVLMKKFTARILTATAFAVDIVAGIIVFAVGKGSLPVLFICFAAVGLSTGMLLVTITTMLSQTAGYVAAKEGYRVDGACFSMNSFAIKAGQAVASAAVSFLLAATGYVANQPQTQQALMGILATRSIVPAVFAVLGLICVLCWNIDKK
ncbi:glycoside-pentoside-hexuronide (GPH):cation symporter [Lachnospiraceae bacterium ASD3451]|uniref:MFS transporter n=1 Tax=Diplocloster agilis TaxID=2850323 RepID=UPI001DE52FDC|nr:glycoside-pentoside-hexuronide (GPH):cation symporter [Diplocloster agilis]MBU9747142.1 glycoside-pentoside-hexuronide (GPH):cation symporter [Diplocloster agilis]